MIRINQIKMSLIHTQEELWSKAAKLLKINKNQIQTVEIQKKSIDARKKPELYYVYSINVKVPNEAAVLKKVNDKNIMSIQQKKYHSLAVGTTPLSHKPVIIGAGPAGLFCAYLLAKEGYAPILMERGKAVDERQKDVEKFFHTTGLDFHPGDNVDHFFILRNF